MGIFLPFVLIIFGFIYAFIGSLISSTMNHVPLHQMIDELTLSLRSLLVSREQSIYLSFDFVHDFFVPGMLYLLAAYCMIFACKLIYEQMETEKLEESFIRIAIMTVVGLMIIVLFYNGGATLFILSIVAVFLINIYQWSKLLFLKVAFR